MRVQEGTSFVNILFLPRSSNNFLCSYPNQHDYDELGIIYAHLESTTISVSVTMPKNIANDDFSAPNSWGKTIRSTKDGGASTDVRDFGKGNAVVTFVIWANE